MVGRIAAKMPADRRPDETCSAGDQNVHGLRRSSRRTEPWQSASDYSKISASARSGALRSLSDRVTSAAGNPPVDADRRIVEPDRSVMLRRIALGHLVDDLGVGNERHEAVRKTLRHQDLVPLLRRNLERQPGAERRRAFPNVDRDVEDRAADDPDQLVLGKGRQLVVKPAKHAGRSRQGMIVLDEDEVYSLPPPGRVRCRSRRRSRDRRRTVSA